MTPTREDFLRSLIVGNGFESPSKLDGALLARRTVNGRYQAVSIECIDDSPIMYVETAVHRKWWFTKYRTFLIRGTDELDNRAEIDRITEDFDMNVIGYLDQWNQES